MTWRDPGEFRVETDMDGEWSVELPDQTRVYQAESPWEGGIAINPQGDKERRFVIPWSALQLVAGQFSPAQTVHGELKRLSRWLGVLHDRLDQREGAEAAEIRRRGRLPGP